MNAAAIAVLSFIVVSGVTFLAAYLMLRWFPAVESQRLRPAGADLGASSILRFDSQIQSR